MPATNSTSERSFSALTCVKSYLRSTMKQEQLNYLMLQHVHKTGQIHLTSRLLVMTLLEIQLIVLAFLPSTKVTKCLHVQVHVTFSSLTFCIYLTVTYSLKIGLSLVLRQNVTKGAFVISFQITIKGGIPPHFVYALHICAHIYITIASYEKLSLQNITAPILTSDCSLNLYLEFNGGWIAFVLKDFDQSGYYRCKTHKPRLLLITTPTLATSTYITKPISWPNLREQSSRELGYKICEKVASITRQEKMQENDQKLFQTTCKKVARNKAGNSTRQEARY